MTEVRTRPMTVGELSRRTGVPVKALREYADWGLIHTMGRSTANYRQFDEDSLWCVRRITRLRGLGLTLAEIQRMRRRIDEYEATHRDELTGRQRMWADNPRSCPVDA